MICTMLDSETPYTNSTEEEVHVNYAAQSVLDLMGGYTLLLKLY